MDAELTKQYGKTRLNIKEPDLKALAEAVNALRTSVRDAQQEGFRLQDDEISELLAELHIEPGEPAVGEALSTIHG